MIAGYQNNIISTRAYLRRQDNGGAHSPKRLIDRLHLLSFVKELLRQTSKKTALSPWLAITPSHSLPITALLSLHEVREMVCS